MRRSLVFAFAITLLNAVQAQAQVGTPGIDYSYSVAAGDGVQQYPYDQQDPWIHGYFQRYPAYGGFSSFRPYNYRHVFSQTQIANGWGMSHGMPYSQQFWNKYRGSYLDGNLHAQLQATPAQDAQPLIYQPQIPVVPAAAVRPIGYETQPVAVPRSVQPMQQVPQSAGRPVHVFPNR
jgi:hypothetical protein